MPEPVSMRAWCWPAGSKYSPGNQVAQAQFVAVAQDALLVGQQPLTVEIGAVPAAQVRHVDQAILPRDAQVAARYAEPARVVGSQVDIGLDSAWLWTGPA